jgi:error-prone DNA polymerase
LRCKSNFSFLTGASHPDELVNCALDQGLAGIALTDINGVYGMPKGYQITKDYPNFKYICGAEFTFYDHPNLTVLAQTKGAYALICQMLTHSKSGKIKGEGNLFLNDFLNFSNKISNELVIIPRLGKDLNLFLLRKHFKNLYLPLTFYIDGNDQKRTEEIVQMSEQFNIPLVATNDVEYHVKSRKIVQDVLISIREGKPLSEVGFKIQPNGERYIKSYKNMKLLYKDFPEALENTLKIARSCTFSPSELKYRYPSEWIPKGFTAQNYLEHLVWEKIPLRYKTGISDKVLKLVQHELNLIRELNFADYFLTIFDIVQFANEKNILCQGRGSAANSVICYILGITAIDPVQMDLLFERFISVERGEPPDIDIDFEHERREEVIQYIYNKYGRNRAGMISAVVTYRFRSAFREVCKAFGLPVGTLSAKKVEQNFEDLIKDLPNPDELRFKIDSITNEIQGFPRHLSIHSGGFTLSADPITDIVPVEPARMDGRTIIQWDKYDLDILGLIKVDILALGMLTCLAKALKLVNKKLYEIPHDDFETYQMIHRRETVGVFQIESRAQMSMLGRLKPSNFYDLVIEVAIVRPGPIIGKMIHPYLKRRRGLEKITYPNEAVKRILGKTLGIPLFQEQIMKLAIELAGFTPGESDILRKSINAWRSSAPITEMAEKLKNGFLKNGMSKEFAKQIFEQIQGFSHYGFPESHAASFALLAYASSYLKRHHPAEFACSLVNSQPMGFYRSDTILYEAIRNGVRVLPVSVLKSNWDCVIEDKNTIRLGFRMVKGISSRDVDQLLREREANQFKSLGDFMRRSSLKKDILSKIALAGRFDEFKWEARDALWAILEYEHLFDKGKNEQMNLFVNTPYMENLNSEKTVFKKMSNFEEIKNDYDAFSLSMHGHPMKDLRDTHNLPKMTSKDLLQAKINTKIKISGLVLIKQKPPTAKGTCFATLEDEFGFIDVIIWKNVFDKYKETFLNQCFITIEGILQKDENTICIVAQKILPVWENNQLLTIEPNQYFYG